jgi:hypothetical protein
MTKVDHLSRLFGIIRQDLKADRRLKLNQTSSSSQTQSNQTIDQFARSLSERLEQLDEKSLEQSTNLFVKSLLAWEFGYEILDDNKHHLLVNKIVNFLIEDEQSSKALQKILKI